MKVCIHRGTKEIGGSCVELESQGKRIIVDLGLPLDSDESPENLLPGIKGLDGTDPTLLGIFISHPHKDHFGLLGLVSDKIRVGMGASARRILRAAAPFFRDNWTPTESGWDFEDRQTLQIGPFAITPYLMDHSAYDAYALLIESDGKRLFYSGDFRGHGRKGVLLDRLVKNPPENIDALLMEGSTLGRLDKDSTFPTEAELESKFIDEFKKTRGLCMVHTSAQNIDRIVTLFRACKQSNRTLVLDLYALLILAATGNPNLPQSDWEGVSTFIPQRQREIIKNNKWFENLRIHSKNRIFPEHLVANPENYVIAFRPIHQPDLEKADCLQDACYIYSQWEGYWKRGDCDRTKNWIKKHGLKKVDIHTSGHASIPDLKKLVKGLNPKTIVPIHSFFPESYESLYGNVTKLEDGELWEVT